MLALDDGDLVTRRRQLVGCGHADDAGTDKSNALSATIWLCSMDDFAEMNAVWDAWATGGNAPCRACVESPRLASPDFTVEIGLIAAR